MANVKDLIVNGAARIIGKVYAPEFVGKLAGNAETATKLGTANVGSTSQPIYLNGGTPTKIGYTIETSVPKNALFTDHTYELVGTQNTTGLVKNGSSVTSASGYTACPIVGGVPYYKDTNSTSVSATTTGGGNAVTAVDASGSVITVTKGATFLTAHQDISGKEDKSNKVKSWSSTTTDDHYPSEKLVKTALDGKANTFKVSSTNPNASWGNTVTVGTVAGTELKFTMPSNPTSDFDYRGRANTWSAVNTFSNGTDVTSGSGSASGAIIASQGGIWAAGGIRGNKVYNAVWNDLADCIPVDDDCELIPGYCYCFDGEKYYKSSKYLDDGIIGIHSDTYGMHMGYKDNCKQMDVAVAGFVLAYVDKEYPVGTPLTCTESGYLTRIEKSDKMEYPEKIVATYWKNESSEYWGGEKDKIKVNGRKWVKIK